MITVTGSGTTSPIAFYTSTLPARFYRFVQVIDRTVLTSGTGMAARVGLSLPTDGFLGGSAQTNSPTGSEKSTAMFWLEPGDTVYYEVYEQFIIGGAATSGPWTISLGIFADADVLGG